MTQAQRGRRFTNERALSNFELRYSSGSLTSLNFSAVPDVQFVNAGLPGERQVVIVEGLEPSTEYRFAMVSKGPSGQTSSLSNVAVIRTNDEDDAIPPGYVLDLQALTPSNIPQPIGNLITVDEEESSLVDGDLATVWQPALDGDALTTTIVLPEPKVVGSVELSTLAGFEDWQPGFVSATRTLTGPVARDPGLARRSIKRSAINASSFQTINPACASRLPSVTLGNSTAHRLRR